MRELVIVILQEKALGKWQCSHSKGAWGNVTVIWGNL